MGLLKIPRTPPDEIKLAAARETAEEIAQAGLGGRGRTEDIESMAADIAKHARFCDDGYELAKNLDDREGWEINAHLVEYLDSHSFTLANYRDAWLKQWLVDNKVEPPFPPGTRVKYCHGQKSGTITGIYEYRPACYLIKDDNDPDANTERCRRAVVWWDQVEPIEEAA